MRSLCLAGCMRNGLCSGLNDMQDHCGTWLSDTLCRKGKR